MTIRQSFSDIFWFTLFHEICHAYNTYTFTLSDSEKNPRSLTNDRVGKKAEIGTGLSYQGIPYYMNQMNEWIRTFSQKFNDILISGYSGNGDPGVKMFTGNQVVNGIGNILKACVEGIGSGRIQCHIGQNTLQKFGGITSAEAHLGLIRCQILQIIQQVILFHAICRIITVCHHAGILFHGIQDIIFVFVQIFFHKASERGGCLA